MTVRRYETLVDPSGKKFVSDDAAKKGGPADKTDHDTRRRVFPQEDFNQMVREARAKASEPLPPGVTHASNTIVGMYAGHKGTAPSFRDIARAVDEDPRRIGVVPVSDEMRNQHLSDIRKRLCPLTCCRRVF